LAKHRVSPSRGDPDGLKVFLGCVRRFQLRARLGRPWHHRAIDRSSGKVLGHVSDHTYPNEVTAIPGTTLAVEPDSGSDRAVFVDASTFAVKKRVPELTVVTPKAEKFYVAQRSDDSLDLANR
jgi:hypothetical protein